MMSYLILYIVSLLLCALSFKFRKIIYFKLALIFLFIFGGLRYGNGADFASYWEMHKYSTIDETFFEFGYVTLCEFFRILGLGPQAMFLFAMGLTLYLIYKSIIFYNKKHVTYILFLFLFLGFYCESFNAVRQYIAIGFFFYATRYIIKKSFIKYALVIIVGSSFHISLLFLLPFYFLLDRKFSDFIVFVALLLSLFILVFFPISNLLTFIPIYGEKYLVENTVFAKDANLGLGYYSKFIIALLLIPMRHKIIRCDNNYNLVVNAFFFYIVFMTIFSDMMVFLRVAYYFHIFLILILPSLSLVFTTRSRLLVNIIIYLYAILIFYVQMSDPINMLTPYRINFDIFTTTYEKF